MSGGTTPAAVDPTADAMRRSRRRPGLLVSGLVALLVVVSCGGAVDAPVGKLFFGTLVSDPSHTAAEAAAGIGVAMLELSWSDYEPARGEWNEAYIRAQQERLRALLASNRRVSLALGVHYTPDWVFDLPDSRYVDDHGQSSDELNVVFNQGVRDEVATYLSRVAGDLGIDNFWSVRLTSGGLAEVLYPEGGSYWAFDANALGGPALPPSLRPNPLPDWRPGGTDVPGSAVANWADWYVSALADVVTWQMKTLENLGFTGYFEVLTPGSGVRPAAYRRAVDRHLPPGLLGVGAAWDRLYAALPRDRNVVAYVSSVADGSGGDDSCAPTDRTVALDDPTVQGWSATRWISRVADEYGFLKRGENPGYDESSTLGDHYRDASADGMMAAAVRQSRDCGFQGLYWAHDEQLWDGTVDFARFESLARDVNGPTAPAPPGLAPSRAPPN